MSQERDTIKYKPNKNNTNHCYNNNSNNHNTMKYENKRSSVAMDTAAAGVGCDGVASALYENFMTPHHLENVIDTTNQNSNNKNNNHNNNQIYSYLAVENNSNQTQPFIGAQQFVYETSTQLNGNLSSILTNATRDIVVVSPSNCREIPNYENIDFGDQQNLETDRKVLLQKYFRTALVGPRDNIYENLCRGCNYGVFTARGPLCSFCECIVNGVQSLGPTPDESTNNIYENICEHCSQFYSGNDAEECSCRRNKKLELEFSFREEEEEDDEKPKCLKKSDSDDCLIKSEKEIKEPVKQVKIRKSQSFNKSVKPKRLASFWESLRKNRSGDVKGKNSKPTLEIVHNVEGYDQVFHTKDTFDLQRICELKRSVTSCSDQHIYGRLKNRDLELLKSQEDFLSTQSLSQHEKGPKKKRISKVKFLRSASSNVGQEEVNELSTQTLGNYSTNHGILQSVYLNASICQWLASLRHHHHRQVHDNSAVNTWLLALGVEDFDECLCYPKSIPAKRYHLGATFNKTNTLTQRQIQLGATCRNRQVPHNFLMTNKPNIEDLTEIVTLRNPPEVNIDGGVVNSSTESLVTSDYELLPDQDHYQQMVEEFMWHLINKQVKRPTAATTTIHPQHSQQQGVETHYPLINMASGGNKCHMESIPLRQANTNHNKAKRQGMYLRLEETPNLQVPATTTMINNNSCGNLPVLPKESKEINNSSNERNGKHTNLLSDEREVESTNESSKERENKEKEIQQIHRSFEERELKEINEYSMVREVKEILDVNDGIQINQSSKERGINETNKYSKESEINEINTCPSEIENNEATNSSMSNNERENKEINQSFKDRGINETSNSSNDGEFVQITNPSEVRECKHINQSSKEMGIDEINISSNVSEIQQINEPSKSPNDREMETTNHALNERGINEINTFSIENVVSSLREITKTNFSYEENAIKEINNSFKKREFKTDPESPRHEHKRVGIHERNILKAFEELLRQEQTQQQQHNHHHPHTKQIWAMDETTQTKESQSELQQTHVPKLATFVVNAVNENKQMCEIPIFELIHSLQLSTGLNTIVVHYSYNERVLWAFLVYSSQAGEKYKHLSHEQMVRKYQRFLSYLKCCSQNKHKSKSSSSPSLTNEPHSDHNNTLAIIQPPPLSQSVVAETSSGRVDLKLDLMKTNGSLYGRIIVRKKTNESFSNGENDNEMQNKTISEALIKSEINNNNYNNGNNSNNQKTRKSPPAVPKRSPNTKLSPLSEQLPPIPAQRSLKNMTKPPASLTEETRTMEEESIYQPIWKFQTLGEVEEHTDEDYYSLDDLKKHAQCNDTIPEICINEEDEDDHSEWEPDEEFIFSTNTSSVDNKNPHPDISSLGTSLNRTESLGSQDRNSTMRSNRSHDSTLGSTSLSGSTITDFASSTATLASNVSSSLMNHMYRNIAIFYSLTEPKLRAIIYDYDRLHAGRYFAKSEIQNDDNNDSGLGKSPTPSVRQQKQKHHHMGSPILQQQHLQAGGKPNKCISSESVMQNNDNTTRSSQSSTSSATVAASAKVLTGSNLSPITTRNPFATENNSNNDSGGISSSSSGGAGPLCNLPSSSVLAWKQQLLNVNYMEDEEDMIVSESEILRAQMVKEDVQPQQFTQRYKSRSTENFLVEDDEKKSMADRVKSRLQRGFLQINSKVSPKSEKKAYKALRNAQTTSLYMEDGLKPKYPIFGTPLDQLELNRTTCPNVPRFVVDSIEYIERNDRIVQDGLYRACGNKYIIDELKQKLSKSYIYDPKLIAADDIHTVTSLLKQFFRDLPQPLIPQETYNCLARDLLKSSDSHETFRIAINEMPEPNKSTLAYLIKHLTNVAACSGSNRMTASNLAIVWGPSLFTLNEANTYDIGRMNTIAKMLIENFDRIFYTNERLL